MPGTVPLMQAWSPAATGLPQLRLTAPEAVAITPDQHRQAVDLLASMILDYYAQHHPAVHPGEQPPTPG